MEYCHYLEMAENEKHITDVKPCINCDIPICSSCRDSRGYCPECGPISNDIRQLMIREIGMKAFYERMRENGLA